MQFGLSLLTTLLFASSVISDVCDRQAKALPPNKFSAPVINKLTKAEALAGKSFEWLNNGVVGTIKFTFEGEGAVRYHISINNHETTTFKIGLAVYKNKEVIQWFIVEAAAGASNYGCHDTTTAFYRGEDVTYGVQVGLEAP